MVRVTERAATALQDVLTANEAPAEAGVRVAPDGKGSLSMTIDAPHLGDEVILRNETPVLIVDSSLADQLSEMVVDCRPSEEDSQTPGSFVLRSQSEAEAD